MQDVQVKRLVRRERGKTVDYDVVERPLLARIICYQRLNEEVVAHIVLTASTPIVEA